jgi:tRNA pseudouridine55 synthase
METRTTDVTGLALVDKPAGMTSHDVVAVVRRATGAKRAGHAGTLDPFATGLLVVLLGRATRLIPHMQGEPKVYDATIRLGEETDTDDSTGVVVRRSDAPPPDESAISRGVERLTGVIEQLPPAYSAKSVDGVRAYTAARRGAPLELSPVSVVVHEWKLGPRVDNDLHARITCGGGTYVRALARDLGRETGSAAHLTALRRLRSGAFSVDDASTLDDLGDRAVRPPLDAVSHLPIQRLTEAELGRVSHGNPVPARTEGQLVSLLDDSGALVAVAERHDDELRPKTVLADAR